LLSSHIRNRMVELPKGCQRGEENLSKLFHLYDQFALGASFFAYRGEMLEHFTSAILELGEQVKKGDEERTALKKRAPFIMVECFQNILRHGVGRDRTRKQGYFGFFSNEQYLSINTINEIERSSAVPLAQMLDSINEWTEEEKKDKYKEIIQRDSFGDGGGAGLGLIEISRKSGNRLDFEMEDKRDGTTCFHQQVTIGYKSESNSSERISFTKQIEKEMEQESIQMIYKGELDEKSLNPIVDIMASMSEHGQWESLGKLMQTLKQIQMNLFHSDKQMGMILVAESGTNLVIQVAIEVMNEARNPLCDLAKMQFKAQQWRSKDPHRPFAACVAKTLNADKELFSFQLVP
jgi:hypothetical protein